MHGGAGALISIGLLKSISFRSFEACVLQQHDSGGDAFLTSCLWQVPSSALLCLALKMSSKSFKVGGFGL